MSDDELRVANLEAALRAFMALDWFPDSAPGPSYYCVSPVADARKAMQVAGQLLDGKSPFPSDNDGSVSIFKRLANGVEITERAVWLGGVGYDVNKPERVPEKYRELFDSVTKQWRQE